MMNDYDAVMIAEGAIEVDEDKQIEAWQHLVDTGLAWSLQGWFGRTAMDLIQQGVITKKETYETKRDREKDRDTI
tara:strand:+ start:102 stop:326 length:225 start_codon:yes stop_codon:yes gene_type:complete